MKESEFDDLFDKKTEDEEIEEKTPNSDSAMKILEKTQESYKIAEEKLKSKTSIKKPKKKILELTEEEINKTIININQKITITRLMTCYEILTGTSIRENTNTTIDEIITELSYILLNHKLKSVKVNKEDVISILNKAKELEE